MVTLTATPHLDTASITLAVATSGAPPTFIRDYRGSGGAVPPAQLAEWTPVAGGTIGNAHPNAVQIAGDPGDGASIVLSGLEVGETYRLRVLARRRPSVLTVTADVADASSTWAPPLTTDGDVPHELTFTAAAISETLTLTVETAGGTAQRYFVVREVIVWPDGDTLASWSLLALTRADANGTRDVRLPAGASLATGALGVTDAEAALAGPVEYRVVVRDELTDATETATAATTLDGVTSPRLASVVLPQYGRALSMVIADGHAETRPSSSTVHEVIGRAAPVVTLGPLRTRRGEYRVWCESYAEAQAVVALMARGDTMMLRLPDPPGADMYHVLDTSGTRVEYLATVAEKVQRWAVTISYVEVDPPADALLGAVGWTYSALAAMYPSYAAVTAEFTSYVDLLAGPA